MRMLLRCCAAASFAALLSFPVSASAEETEDYDKDASQAESTPPMIPHRIKDTANGEYCGCFKSSVKRRPRSSSFLVVASRSEANCENDSISRN